MGVCSDSKNRSKNINIDAPNPIISASLPESFELRTPINDTKASKPKKDLPELEDEKRGNIIKMKLFIGQYNVNNPVKLLYNSNSVIEGFCARELNETNTELFINNEKTKYKPYFIPEKGGIYDIQLKINIKMKSCCGLFYDLYYLQSVDLSSFDTSNVTNMSLMFYKCRNLQSVDLSSFNTQNVTNMRDMFNECRNLQNLDLSSFNTQNVTDMYGMFCYCYNLQSLDLSSFNTKNVTNKGGMFFGSNNLERIVLSYEESNISKEIHFGKIFYA